MPEQPTLLKANFKIRGSSESFDVHFNPASLQYTISNNLENTGSGSETTQFVADSTGKLTMELVFDTTGTGEDVRLHTIKVAQLMEPTDEDNTPPVAEFEWGLYTFAGMLEKYKENIEFFSADGVPLRATLNITLSSQDQVFEGGSDARRAGVGNGMGGGDNTRVPSPPGGGRGVLDTATQGGNPLSARLLAEANGLESMRFTAGAQLSVSGSVSASAGLSANASAGAAFSGLRSNATSSVGGSIKASNFLKASATAGLGTELSAGISIGGQVGIEGSASFTADVGAAGTLKSQIEFDGGDL